MKKFEMIDHTADVGIRVYAKSLEELFENAAYGLREIILDFDSVKEKKYEKHKINLESKDLEDLFIKWLNELIYLVYTKKKLYVEYKVNKISETGVPTSLYKTNLTAVVEGVKYNSKKHRIKKEVKSATYHKLKISNDQEKWVAEIIFDI